MSLEMLKGEGNEGKGKVKEALDAPRMHWEFWLRSSSSCLLRFLSRSANNGARIDLQGQMSRAARTPRLYSLTCALPEADGINDGGWGGRGEVAIWIILHGWDSEA